MIVQLHRLIDLLHSVKVTGASTISCFYPFETIDNVLTIQGGYESEEKGDKIGPGGDFGVYR